MRNNIKITLLGLGILLTFFIIPLISVSSATDTTGSLEVIYPTISSSSLSVTSTFPHYIIYIYKLLLWISGIIVVLLLIISGISYMSSMGNPSKMEDAKKRMIAGFIGMVIIFSAVLIIHIINPQMAEMTLQSPESPIHLIGTATSSHDNEMKIISIPIRDNFSNPDILSIPYGYKDFSPSKICCSSSLPFLKEIDIFPQKDFEGDTTTITNFNNICYTGTIGSGKFIWSTTTVEGGLQTKYPSIPNTSPPSITSSLPVFVDYWYKLIIWIAGIITVLILIGGGISYISSTGNPARLKEARSIIFAGLTGLGVILFSYLIIKIVNPQLGTPQVQSLSNLGIWLEDSEKNKFPVNNDIPKMPQDFSWPEKICFPTSSNSLAKKQIKGLFLFPEENFEGKGRYFSLGSIECQNIGGYNVKSIKIDWDLPGLYIEIANNASTVVPFLIRGSNPNLEETLGDFYKKEWRRVKMKDGPNTFYSAIFYKNTDFLPPATSTPEGGWIYPGTHHPTGGSATTYITFPKWDYTKSNYLPDRIYKFPPKFGSVQIFDRDPNGVSNVSVWLYKAGNYMEKDESGNDLTCPHFCPYEGEIDFPQDLSPDRFNLLPHKEGCAYKVESLRRRGLVILIQSAYYPSSVSDPPAYDSTEISYPFQRAEAFLSDQPDLSKTPIGQCGSRSWRHMFRYIPEPCPQYIMLLSLKH